jgi:hypothetical protein
MVDGTVRWRSTRTTSGAAPALARSTRGHAAGPGHRGHLSDRDHFLLQFLKTAAAAEMLPWSPLTPPFENAVATPGGWVWLEKSRPVVDSVRTYQVIAPSGALSHLVVYPSRQGRVIALTDSLALVAEQYKDGVRLMQVALPAVPSSPEAK